MQSVQQLLMIALGVVVFLLVITALVAVHELGHYLVAKLCGMRVEAFAVMMGGRRVTDLSELLVVPLVQRRLVVAVTLFSAALLLAGALTGVAGAFTVGLALLGMVIPIWVGTRIGALYHISLAQSAKVYLFCWLGAMAVAAPAARSGITADQILGVLAIASYLALAVLYYQPVLRKGEEEAMGEGNLAINGRDVPVRFRPLLAHRTKSGTEFSLLCIPLGGFAAIRGMHPKEDGSETQVDGGFYSKSATRRLASLLAGPLFSVLFGVLLFAGLFSTLGMEKPIEKPIIGSVGETMMLGPGKGTVAGPAYAAGLRVGDLIVAVQGVGVSTFYEALRIIRNRPGMPTDIEYRRGDKVFHARVTPIAVQDAPVLDQNMELTEETRTQGKVGISPATGKTRLPLSAAFAEAWSAPVKMVQGLISIARKPSRAQDEIGGPGTIAVFTIEATAKGFGTILLLAAMLSVSLGVMNLLPIPPLDGGQMVVAFIELLRGGRRLSLQIQQMVSTGGMILVAMLVVGVIALDLNRFLGAPKDKPATQSQQNR